MTAVLILHCASATLRQEWQEFLVWTPDGLSIKCKLLLTCTELNTDFGPMHRGGEQGVFRMGWDVLLHFQNSILGFPIMAGVNISDLGSTAFVLLAKENDHRQTVSNWQFYVRFTFIAIYH